MGSRLPIHSNPSPAIRRLRLGPAGVLLTVLFCGCESPGWANKLDEIFSPHPKFSAADEERHREEYVLTRDRASLDWLLRHRIDNGMSYAGVCKILGEDGRREMRDQWIKTGGGSIYQTGDFVYAFGPASDGKTLYLVFRDDRLVGFDGADYGSSEPPKGWAESDKSEKTEKATPRHNR